jgi:hypothetical protein
MEYTPTQMATGLTVADVRALIGNTIYPGNPNSELFLPTLNQVVERIINSGQWKNMYEAVDYDSTSGYITLPRRLESIVGVTRVNWPTSPYARMNEYMTSGPGFLDETSRDLRTIIDQGDVCMQEVQTQIGYPRLTIASAIDDGLVVRLYGHDSNGDPIFDQDGVEGIALTLTNPTVTASVEMFVTQVVKPMTVGNVTLSIVVSGTPTVMSVYEPSETNPVYRRYKTGTIVPRDDNKPVLRCLCKRRFVRLMQESDLVWPDNIGALKFGMRAIQLEDSGGATELQLLQGFWQKCYEILNQGLKQNRGAIRPKMAMDWMFSAGETPQTR